jgi:NTE family protein
LILGGGGVTGIAWTTGVVLGLHEQGVDLLRAHRIIGTSAGSTVGAQITSGIPFSELFAQQTDSAKQSKEINPEPQQLRAFAANLLPLMNITNDAERIRRIAEIALASKTIDESARRAVIEDRLPSHHWSRHPLSIVAIDTHSHAMKLLDRHSGVSLVDAVAASCAVPGLWPPVTINEHRYMDGGVRTPDNADLASECAVVLVMSPMGLQANPGLTAQVAALHEKGVRVRVIEPDPASKSVTGLNPFDLLKRAPAAHAGRQQGRALGGELAAFWD